MNADDLAQIYAQAFPQTRAWSAAEFRALLAPPLGFLVSVAGSGFAVGRVIAGEAELITLAVLPDLQRRGVGAHLLTMFEDAALQRRASRAFLEVAEDNSAAIALYSRAKWRESGRRKGYYNRANLPLVDALVLEKRLTERQVPNLSPENPA